MKEGMRAQFAGKKDGILALVFLGAALLLGIIWLFVGRSTTDGTLYAVVQKGDSVLERLPLSENAELYVDCGEGEYNVVVVENGKVYVREASCPDGICIRTGEISYPGESIVCLPHSLIVTLAEGAEEE